MKSLEQRVKNIEQRNHAVELNKAWETSLTRRFAVAIATYVVIVALMFVIKAERPFISAMVPVGGYLLSTLSLRYIRKVWENNQ